MKNNTSVLLVLLLAGVGVSAYGNSGDAIFEQPYTFGAVDGDLFYESIADDFIPLFSGEIGTIVFYQSFNTAQPSQVFLEITKDIGNNNPNYAVSIFSGSVTVSSYVATDDSVNTHPIYEVVCELPAFVSVQSDSMYWLEVGLAYNSFLPYQEPAAFGSSLWYFQTGHYNESSGNQDLFFNLLTPVALERITWGEIKSSF